MARLKQLPSYLGLIASDIFLFLAPSFPFSSFLSSGVIEMFLLQSSSEVQGLSLGKGGGRDFANEV